MAEWIDVYRFSLDRRASAHVRKVGKSVGSLASGSRGEVFTSSPKLGVRHPAVSGHFLLGLGIYTF